MKYSKTSSVRTFAFGIVLATSSLASAQSYDSLHRLHESACSERTLWGDYGAKIEGTILDPHCPNCPLRTLVLFRFDGHGGLIGFDRAVVAGNAPPDDQWGQTTGTYIIDPDCKGSVTLVDRPNFHFIVVNRGRQFYFVVDGSAISGEARKVD
ncbi:MAG: hypothetical protein JO270_09620 [Acidobacteriaceae bacterium]|nr:hypothetical protein [Acidobacteriaceae bacterium]MBV8572892.1 hypothetical protein [Acidobacteriaceae bacterium]